MLYHWFRLSHSRLIGSSLFSRSCCHYACTLSPTSRLPSQLKEVFNGGLCFMPPSPHNV
nr:MAG TPA: hypothetical protein [Caudoviricetes sp.]